METNDLKIFQKIAQLHSITETAEQMGYTQSNITSRLKILESELKTPLFKRTNKGVEILKSGEILLTYADRILDLIEKAKYEITNKPKELSLGATQVITKTHLTKLLINNNFNFTIYTRDVKELIGMVETFVLDGIFINELAQNSNLICIYSHTEPIAWFKSKDDEIFLLQHKPIFISRNKQCPYRKATIAYLERNEILGYTMVEIDSLDTIITLLENNMGYSVLPIQLLSKQLKFVNNASKLDDIEINLYVHRKNEDTMRTIFRDVL